MANAPSSHHADFGGTRRLTVLYVVALSAIALLTIVGQWSVQRSLARQHRTSTVINVAGRQRMLSQKITKTALLWEKAPQAERAELQAELKHSFDEWQRAHEALQSGTVVSDAPVKNSDEVQALFDKLAPHYLAMVESVRSGLAGSTIDGWQPLLAHEPQFLATMDAIVNQYDREAQADVSRLRVVERLLLAITLIVLLLEGTLIFRPAVRRIQATMQALADARRVAEESNAEKSRFLARVSHDLRTPLNAILGLVDVSLAKDRQSPNPHLLTMRDASDALLRLVDMLLDSARLEGPGVQRVELTPVELGDFITRIVRLFEQQASERKLRLSCRIDDSVPPRLGTDLRMVQQIVMNVVSNAIKFTTSGHVTVSVSATRQASDDYVIFVVVSDTGIGIAAADHRRIFESFTQLENGAPSEGLGLGLHIVARTAAALGGKVSVQSEPGRGSTFTVCVPMQAAEELSPPLSPVAQSSQRLAVLVIEDTLTNQLLFREMLSLLGHQCTTAGTAAMGLAAARERTFDVVLLDLQLPDADGCAVARELRTMPGYAQTPVIGVSAHALAEHRRAALNAGCSDFLSKPLRLAQLEERLGRAGSVNEDQPNLSAWSERPELLRALIGVFLQEWPRQLEQLDAALSDNDAEQAHFAAHRLKGMVANFHHASSLMAATELTQLARDGQFATARKLRDKLSGALQNLANQLAATERESRVTV
jgi:signal transduction histidine kinase/CheY-like chemotaxis protein